MPRVNSATKNKAGQKIQCGRCNKAIEPGQKYFHWKFRYGGKHYRCQAHCPRPSELTQSKMSGVYAAVEGVQDDIAALEKGTTGISELASSLESAAEEVDSVKDEYQESLDNMGENLSQGPTGEEIQEKIDALEEFGDALRTAASEVEDLSKPEEGETEKRAEERREQAIQLAEEACESLSI